MTFAMYTEEQMKSFENKIINMDCLDFLKKCPDNYFSLVLTDPPYGIESKISTKEKKQNAGNKFALLYNEKRWDKKPHKEVFEEMLRVSKNQVICGGNYFSEFLPSSRGWIIWDKVVENMKSINNELIWTSFDFAIKTFRRCHGLDKGFMNTGIDKPFHPTQKPRALFEYIIENCSNENDLVLDCFSGSGTTAIACHNLKRRFICIEKDFDYWKASVERLKEHQRQLSLF